MALVLSNLLTVDHSVHVKEISGHKGEVILQEWEGPRGQGLNLELWLLLALLCHMDFCGPYGRNLCLRRESRLQRVWLPINL